MRDSYKRALAYYTGVGAEKINQWLRGGRTGLFEHRHIIETLDELISKSVLNRDVTLFRGVGARASAELRRNGLTEGTIYVEDGFLSCTTDVDVAMRFIPPEGGGMIVAINVSRGFNAVYAAPYSQAPDEKEVILPRGTTLTVLAFDPVVQVVEMEISR